MKETFDMKRVETTPTDDVVFRRADGAAFFISFEDDELFVHAAAPDGLSGSLVYAEAAESEGRLRIKLRLGVGSQPIRREP